MGRPRPRNGGPARHGVSRGRAVPGSSAGGGDTAPFAARRAFQRSAFRRWDGGTGGGAAAQEGHASMPARQAAPLIHNDEARRCRREKNLKPSFL